MRVCVCVWRACVRETEKGREIFLVTMMIMIVMMMMTIN